MIYNILFASLFLSVLIIIVLIIIYRKEIKRVQKLSYEKVTLENLKKKYDSALIDGRIVGLSIATRPDCINEDIAKSTPPELAFGNNNFKI